MYKHFFFDLDKTLTKSRSPMDDAHIATFDRLCSERDVVVVTGGTVAHIREQVTPRFDGRYTALAQSGNHAIDENGEELWYEPLKPEQVVAVHSFIKRLAQQFDDEVPDTTDCVEDRGAQIGYSVIGYHAPLEKKYAFDPDDTRRQEALKALSNEVRQLTDIGINVTPAGTTGFNFIMNGRHKGFNVARLIKLNGWATEDSVYTGDALFPGGNDETVIGVIPTHPVTNPNETFTFINEMLS